MDALLFRAMASEIRPMFITNRFHWTVMVRYNFPLFHFESVCIRIDSKFTILDTTKLKWVRHRAIEKLERVLNLTDTCGYITFVNTGVPDIGCEQYDINVHLKKPKARNAKEKKRETLPSTHVPTPEEILVNQSGGSTYVVENEYFISFVCRW